MLGGRVVVVVEPVVVGTGLVNTGSRGAVVVVAFGALVVVVVRRSVVDVVDVVDFVDVGDDPGTAGVPGAGLDWDGTGPGAPITTGGAGAAGVGRLWGGTGVPMVCTR